MMVATSIAPIDETVERVARRAGYRTFRGDENDVLSRYVGAAKESRADVVIRITSDCPLLDPAESSRVVETIRASRDVDYASNVLERRLPRGLDTEGVAVPCLEAAMAEAIDPADREHVTRFVVRHPARFRQVGVSSTRAADLSSHRWTLDTPDDYRLLSRLFEELGPGADRAHTDDVLRILAAHPDLRTMNQHVVQKSS